jgi:hypothetical protein
VKSHKPAIATSLLIIGLGIAWLLNAMDFVPGVDWLVVALLGISGILLLTLGRLDRFNFVVGTSLILCSICSVLRQTGKLTINIEAPLLFICVGLLMLVSFLIRLPGSAGKSVEPPASGSSGNPRP